MAKEFPKFPETIYVKQEEDGEDGYLVADADASGLAERGVAVPTGEYRLVQVGVVVDKTSFESRSVPT